MVNSYEFKLAVNLNETGLPFEQAADLAQDLGARNVEFFIDDMSCLSSAGAAPYRHLLEARGLQTHGVGCLPNPFKELHLDQITLADIPTNPLFLHDLDLVRRSLDFCLEVGGRSLR